MRSPRHRHYRPGCGGQSARLAGTAAVTQSFCRDRDLPDSPARWLSTALGLLLLFGASLALAQQSTRYDQYELHHSIVYTTFLSPEIAAEYGIARGRDKAMLTLSVRDAEAGETAGRPMKIEGETWDLIRSYELDIKEIREADATYYIIPFEFLDREYRFFDLTFTPEGSPRSYRYKFNRQLWRQEGP